MSRRGRGGAKSGIRGGPSRRRLQQSVMVGRGGRLARKPESMGFWGKIWRPARGWCRKCRGDASKACTSCGVLYVPLVLVPTSIFRSRRALGCFVHRFYLNTLLFFKFASSERNPSRRGVLQFKYNGIHAGICRTTALLRSRRVTRVRWLR